MVQIEFLIPTQQGSTGRPHSVDAILELERFLEQWGFHTRGIVPGVWRHPDTKTVVREESFCYVTAVPEEDVDQLRQFIRQRAKSLFDQKAIYFSVAGKVELIDP